MISKSTLLSTSLALLPIPARQQFARIYAPAVAAEISKLSDARSCWIDIDDHTFPLLQLRNGTKLVGDSATRLEELLIGSLLSPLSIESTHAKVAIDFVTRYNHPHMAIAYDRIPFPISSRRFFHPQHLNLLQECQSIDTHTKKTAEKIFTPQPTWTVVDIGCYLGYGSLRMSALIPDGRITSVEAVRRNFSIATTNQSLNSATNWNLINGAIWHTDNTSVPLSCDSRQQNAVDSSVARGKKTINVRTVSIPSLSEQLHWNVDLVSLTVNGAEVEAIQGMKKMNHNQLPHRILTPAWYPLNGISRAGIIKPLLTNLGYKVLVTHGEFVLAWLPSVEVRGA